MAQPIDALLTPERRKRRAFVARCRRGLQMVGIELDEVVRSDEILIGYATAENERWSVRIGAVSDDETSEF